MKFRYLGVALLICLMASPAVMGQGQGQGRGGRGGFGGGRGGFGGRGLGGGMLNPLALLNIEAVQEEIELLDEQKEEIRALAEKMRGNRGPGERPNFQDMTDEERQAFGEARRKEAEEQAETAKKELASILLDDQLSRLEQIAIQVAGIQALRDPSVAKKLGISEAEGKEIADAIDEGRTSMFAQMREMRQGQDGDVDRAAMQEKMQELRKQNEEKVLAVLSSDQRKQFEEMKGEPFEMPEGGFGRFGGPGGRGGPGGQGGFGGRRGGGDGNRPARPGRPE